jgi:hypothetical protein
MRIPFIAGNWKMFKTVLEAVVFTKELRLILKDVADVEIVIAPPFTAIHAVSEAARNTNIGVSAQDVYWEREGAFTGAVSAAMVKEAGAAYAISTAPFFPIGSFGWNSLFVALAMGSPVIFWLWARAVFEENFAARPWHGGDFRSAVNRATRGSR